MDSLQRASSVLFYILGAITIAMIVLVNRGIAATSLLVVLDVIDLPLLFVAILFAGSTFIVSLSKGQPSTKLIAGVFVPLGVAFIVFAWLNFGLPFPEMGF